MCALLSVLRPRPVQRRPITPHVTVVISAYDEAPHIEATVRNKLEQQYPQELLDVIVASDASTDGTDELLDRLARENSRVTFIRQEQRGGKTAALNRLVERSRGEIIVFRGCELDVPPRRDPHTRGGVCRSGGGLRYRAHAVRGSRRLVGWGRLYCLHDIRERIARLRDRRGSIVGVDGGVDAVRRSLYQSMRSDQLPDLVLPLTVVEQGYRVVFVPEAIVEERTPHHSEGRISDAGRVALRAFWALRDKRALAEPAALPVCSAGSSRPTSSCGT